MDMVSFLVGFLVASLIWLFVAAAFSAGKQQGRLEKKQAEHAEQVERVNKSLR